MFYNGYNQNNQLIQTNNYGYPHLGHPIDQPNNHFSITPFEAVYADAYSYDHIVFSKTVAEFDSVSEYDLGRYRDFLNDEVEAWDFCLQNKVIGQNHVINPNYEYKAWYKARGVLKIGKNVTYKTDPGDYIIESTGNITVYGKNAVHITSGFHTKVGSKFHAFIKTDWCALGPFNKSETNNSSHSDISSHLKTERIDDKIQLNSISLYPNPNTGIFTFVTNDVDRTKTQTNTLIIYNLTGKIVHQQPITTKQTQLNLNLNKGLYIINFNTQQLKLIIQ